MTKPLTASKSLIAEQVKRLRLLGVSMLLLAASLQLLSGLVVYYQHLDQQWSPWLTQSLSRVDTSSCTVMASLFALMALFSLGAAWQKRMFLS